LVLNRPQDDAFFEYCGNHGLLFNRGLVTEFERLAAGEVEWNFVLELLQNLYRGADEGDKLIAVWPLAREWYHEIPGLDVDGLADHHAGADGMSRHLEISFAGAQRRDSRANMGLEVNRPPIPKFSAKCGTLGNFLICTDSEYAQLQRYDTGSADYGRQVVNFSSPDIADVVAALSGAVEDHFNQGDEEERFVECRDWFVRDDGTNQRPVTVRLHEHHALMILAWLQTLAEGVE